MTRRDRAIYYVLHFAACSTEVLWMIGNRRTEVRKASLDSVKICPNPSQLFPHVNNILTMSAEILWS